MKYILRKLILKIHDENSDDDGKLEYFKLLSEKYLSEEIYNNLPLKISS